MPSAAILMAQMVMWAGPPTPPTIIDSGIPTILKPKDLTIPEYGLFVLLLRKLRLRRK